MGEVFAGLVCGYVLALVGAPVLGFTLARMRTQSALVTKLFPAEARMVPVVMILHGGLVVVCTGAGLVLGLLLYAMRDAREALGSPNIAFTLLIFALTLALVAPVAIVSARYRRPALVLAGVVLLLFGWLMPYMARWSDFGSS